MKQTLLGKHSGLSDVKVRPVADELLAQDRIVGLPLKASALHSPADKAAVQGGYVPPDDSNHSL